MKAEPAYFNSPEFKHFWNKGIGHELLAWSGAKPDLSLFDQYAPLYYRVDERCDTLVRAILERYGFQGAMQQLEAISQGRTGTLDALSRELMDELQEIPGWLEKNMMRFGAQLGERSGRTALIVLRDFTLTGGYDFSYLNKPLIYTGALKKGPVKRLKDTLNFWVHATRPDGLLPGNKGFRFSILTRLMHSLARVTIESRVPEWDRQHWGRPINHFDMIATSIGFSLTFALGLKKMGIHISKEEEAGLFHLWKYAGYLLGIPVEYLPENKKQATEILYCWTTLQPRADSDSVLLTTALIDENLISPVFDKQSQREKLRYLHICCIRYFLDDETCTRLQVPEVKRPGLFPLSVRITNQLKQLLLSRSKQISSGHAAQLEVLKLYSKGDPKQ